MKIKASSFFNFAKIGRALDFAHDVVRFGGRQPTFRGVGATGLRRGRAGDFGTARGFDDQTSRRDQVREFGVAKLFQESPDVAIDRLFPKMFTRSEVTADPSDIDPRISAAAYKAINPPSPRPTTPIGLSASPARDSNQSTACAHGFDLEADHMPTGFVGHPIKPFAMS